MTTTTALNAFANALSAGRRAVDPADDWTQQALCPQTDPETFFPLKGGTAVPGQEICRRCPVLLRCLQEALDVCEPYGTFGALTVRQRRRLNYALASGDQREIDELSKVAGVDLSGLRPNQSTASQQELRLRLAADQSDPTPVAEDRLAG